MAKKAKPKKAAAGHGKSAVLAAQLKAQPKKLNPFELKGAKGHFDTMGRRLSGKKHNVIKARQEAVNRRKKTLLVEYRQLRKANSFVDRRFGEGDPALSEADKGLARLAAQRTRRSAEEGAGRVKKKRGSKFTLSEAAEGGEGPLLTHRGRSLADDDDLRALMEKPEFDDLDDEMAEELVAKYHFGGGGEEGEGAEEEGAEDGDKGAGAVGGKPKTRKQVMEEIIAKSRMYRALKAQQKEADEQELDQLNDTFKQLVRSAALAKYVKPPKADKWGGAGWLAGGRGEWGSSDAEWMEGLKVPASDPADAAYDVAARELAFEAKGAATERTLTPEELAERERQRLEALEKERLKRMRGGADSADEEGSEEGEEGSEDGGDRGRKRRREHQSGDALGDDFDSEGAGDSEEADEGEDEEGGKGGGGPSALDERRMRAAAGDHPLQESFRAAAAALAAKYGVAAPQNPYLQEEGEDDEEEEGEEGESDEDEEGEGAESGSGEGEEAGVSGSGGGEDEEEEGEGGSEDEDEDEQGSAANGAKAAAPQPKRAATAAASPAAPLDGPLDLPYTISLPSSYADFAALVRGRPSDQLAAAISRIRAFNAVALATDNKRKLQEFFGVLVQHFAMLAGQSPPPAAALDVLSGVLGQLAAEVPFYAATVARARLARLADNLTQALAALGGEGARRAAEAAGSMSAVVAGAGASVAGAPAQPPPGSAGSAPPTSPWPPARAVLQLKLFAQLFPTSDRRHPVLTPAALFIGKVLSQCVVSNPHEAAVGLCLCSLLTHMAAPARRTAPEALVFLRDCLAAFVPPPAQRRQAASSAGADSEAFVRFPPGLLALGPDASPATAAPQLDLYGVLGCAPTDPRVTDDAFRLGLLRAALCGVRRCAALAAGSGFSGAGSSAGGGGEGGAGLVCYEQLFAPLLAAVRGLAAVERRLPQELQELRSSVQRQLTDASAACVAARRPLVNPSRARSVAGALPAAAVREFNPRFEEGFALGRDYDPDRQRAEERRLKRALVKERRGAIRELRRDAAFLAEERDAATAAVDAERMASERHFYAELQRQEADMRSGGQAGMNPHLKKKKK
ncbi:hypothetical protein GPECTOR_10g758 [Gonium pectorale]|uniref:Nop14-like protein n=1 Tax=Gonium pectorale TaxID=33097 RepID=A0A150GQL3_GONPE|nr:hypothetical protein GPECTOR_10g758 [Gonium pectorale]|eukprot:KXZ52129.1 hypothetical protein GPECTOR_10g758 [Gonium pectorale]